MTTEFLIAVELIKNKVAEVNYSIELLEKTLFEKSEADLASYMSETSLEKFFLKKWVRQLKQPKSRAPIWHSLTSTIKMQRVLFLPSITHVELSPLLNLYALNAAITATELKAEGIVIQQIRELTLISEDFRQSF